MNARLSPFFTVFATVAAGTAMASNYLLQPVLPAVATTLGIDLASAGLIAASTQIGYMLGILLIVPLGDVLDKRTQITWQFLILAAAIWFCALSTSPIPFFLACIVVGSMATNAIQLNALGFQLSEKGSTVGTITMGISAGILLARFVGGAIAQAWGWQQMLMSIAALMLVLALAGRRVIPACAPSNRASYRQVLGRLPGLLGRYPLLRESVMVGGAWFFVFSMLWVALMLHLQAAPLNLDPTATGLFGLAGLAGLLMARYAGALADQIGSRTVIALGLSLVLGGVAVLYLFPHSITGLVIGVVLFDLGCFSAQVANQTRALRLEPTLRSSLFAVYMFCYYGAGALGSLSAGYIYQQSGWRGICISAFIVTAIGLAITWINNKNTTLDIQAAK
ncbi:MAG: MFS transporter [Pseudomonas sp.]|uniref:MFS transporter n=1 Tax=unclassified Pseudomonas TaxID=196821 RepID=UPI001CFAC8D5|nr:MFS transporter [Pseudomonas sp. L5B5]UCZ83994.1 MFS transporter [Pseudomonas sp. L5B5]